MKSYIWWSGDPWSAIFALAALIIVVSLAGIAFIFFTYPKYKKFTFSDRSYSDTLEDQHYCGHLKALREYETQSLNIYVPAENSVADVGELKTASRQTAVQQVSSNDLDTRMATIFSSIYQDDAEAQQY